MRSCRECLQRYLLRRRFVFELEFVLSSEPRTRLAHRSSALPLDELAGTGEALEFVDIAALFGVVAISDSPGQAKATIASVANIATARAAISCFIDQSQGHETYDLKLDGHLSQDVGPSDTDDSGRQFEENPGSRCSISILVRTRLAVRAASAIRL